MAKKISPVVRGFEKNVVIKFDYKGEFQMSWIRKTSKAIQTIDFINNK